MNPKNTSKKNDDNREIFRSGIALSASETVSRFGSANAEFIKGYTGTDNETGQRYAKGLADIAKHKVNSDPMEAAKNIKQQAGFSAEVAATSRDNSEAIIAKSKVRTIRSDDITEYGRNHNIVDRVQILDGQIIEGSQAQMKFVGNRDQLFKDIALEGKKFERYRGTKLELPSEQYEGAAQHCREEAQQLRFNADRAEQSGKTDISAKLRREANNYEELANNISDSGITTEQAIFYRKYPKIATAIDMARTSHKAGLEGAKYGSVIGGSISLLQNIFALAQNEKSLGDASTDFAIDTTKAAALGYSTAFAGSIVKSGMQQSSNQTMRSLAGSSAPALAVNVCVSLSGSIKRYVQGEITESQLLAEVGEKSTSMLASGMIATLGQIAIPIPFLGAAIGGIIGHTLSSIFYQAALDSARSVEISREIMERTQAIQAAAREKISQEQTAFNNFLQREFPQLQSETQQLFSIINSATCNIDELTSSINKYATILGKNLRFNNLNEFNEFMNSGEPLRL
ncbi:hypothetical protein [Malikia sp.]|uniref:hypothetical protein n=1 Tax=Malikia sp. TaxID=2070706 RepID=UPI002608DB3C|nr:hypothetical protein [Malikia sp.]MDD2729034.1 hypothetical protein [Malikia sp.]